METGVTGASNFQVLLDPDRIWSTRVSEFLLKSREQGVRGNRLDTIGMLDSERFIVSLREDRDFIDCISGKKDTRIVENLSRGVRTKYGEGANILKGAGEARLF